MRGRSTTLLLLLAITSTGAVVKGFQCNDPGYPPPAENDPSGGSTRAAGADRCGVEVFMEMPNTCGDAYTAGDTLGAGQCPHTLILASKYPAAPGGGGEKTLRARLFLGMRDVELFNETNVPLYYRLLYTSDDVRVTSGNSSEMRLDISGVTLPRWCVRGSAALGLAPLPCGPGAQTKEFVTIVNDSEGHVVGYDDNSFAALECSNVTTDCELEVAGTGTSRGVTPEPSGGAVTITRRATCYVMMDLMISLCVFITTRAVGLFNIM